MATATYTPLVYEYPPGHRQPVVLVGTIAIDPATGLPVDLAGGVPVRGGSDDIKTAIPVMDTSILADNEVASATYEITNFFTSVTGTRLLQSLTVHDASDQGAAIDIYLLNSNVSLGTVNGAISISATNSKFIKERVQVAAADYADLINSRKAFVSPIGKVLKANGSSTSLWLSVVSRGTPTYAAADALTIELGVI